MNLDNLRISLTNLLDEFGQAESPLYGLAINLGFATVGVAFWYLTTAWYSALGLVLAAICLLAIVQWVIGA